MRAFYEIRAQTERVIPLDNGVALLKLTEHDVHALIAQLQAALRRGPDVEGP